MRPSVVYIETDWEGYVRPPENNSVNIPSDWYGPYKATTVCSGFVANSSGYVVTAGHCVDNQSMTEGGKEAIVRAGLVKEVEQGNLTEKQAEQLYGEIMATGAVEGDASGSPPYRSVTVFQPTSSAGGQAKALALTAADGLVANVIELKGTAEGDVALLKVNPPEPMPAVQVAGQSPQTGTHVIAAGYPGSFAGLVDAGQQPSFKSGSVSSTQTVNGVPFIETNAENTAGMSGGPTFDTQGRVLGTVSWGPAQEAQEFNFSSDTSVLKAMLTRNGVSNALSTPDQAYRAGLSDYYAGRYHDAVTEFDKVLAVEPSQALARDFRAKAIANYGNEATGTSPWLWVGIGAGALVVIGAGVTVLLISRRRRARPTPAGGVTGPVPPPPPTAAAAMPPANGAPSGAESRAEETRPPTSPPPAPAQARSKTPAEGATAGPGAQEGEPNVTIFCPRCGTPHSPESRFCETCGQALTKVNSGRATGRSGSA